MRHAISAIWLRVLTIKMPSCHPTNTSGRRLFGSVECQCQIVAVRHKAMHNLEMRKEYICRKKNLSFKEPSQSYLI